MRDCYRCGKPIEFYTDASGQARPRHIDGGWCERNYSASGVNSFAKSARSEESTCFPTTCPICQADVFFIRHNGGSVWVDPPLGWPWPEHECFGEKKERNVRTRTTLADQLQGLPVATAQTQVLGVVVEAAVELLDDTTVLYIEAGSRVLKLRIKGKLGSFLVGRLALFDPNRKRITAFDNENHAFVVMHAEEIDTGTTRTE